MKFLKEFNKYLNYILKNNKEKRLWRDILLFDKILERSHCILIENRYQDSINIYNFSIFYMKSCDLKNAHFMSQLISKKYAKTLEKMFLRNDKYFFKTHRKWKFEQIKGIKNPWKISNISLDLFGTKIMELSYQNNVILKETTYNNYSGKFFEHKKTLFPSEDFSIDKFALNQKLFEIKIKKNKIIDELFLFYQKIAYNELISIKSFVEKIDS